MAIGQDLLLQDAFTAAAAATGPPMPDFRGTPDASDSDAEPEGWSDEEFVALVSAALLVDIEPVWAEAVAAGLDMVPFRVACIRNGLWDLVPSIDPTRAFEGYQWLLAQLECMRFIRGYDVEMTDAMREENPDRATARMMAAALRAGHLADNMNFHALWWFRRYGLAVL
jgi:hypothetical protein